MLPMFSLAFLLEFNCSRETLCWQLSQTNPAGTISCCCPSLPRAMPICLVWGGSRWVILRSPFSSCWSIVEPWSHHDFSCQQQKGPKQPVATGEHLYRSLHVALSATRRKPVKPKAWLSQADPNDLSLSLLSLPLAALSSFKKGRKIRKYGKLMCSGAPSQLDVGS